MLRQIATACIERRIAPVILFQTRQLQWLAGCAFSINRTCMHTFPAHLLDELARVYARAAVRAYLASTEKDARPLETLAQIAERPDQSDPPACKRDGPIAPRARKRRRSPAREGRQDALDLRWR
jgi:hypothetical protein